MTQPKLVAGSRSMPNGLYGLIARDRDRVGEAAGAGYGPTKIGSGAAWLVDARLLYSALACRLTLSLMSKSEAREHRLALGRRQQQVVRREVEAVGAAEVVVGARRVGSAGFHTGVVVPSLSVTS